MAADSETQMVLRQVAEVLGPEAFNRLVDSVPSSKEKGRLRFWQEMLLDKVAEKTGIHITSLEEFLATFTGTEKIEIPREDWSRDVFLREIVKIPFGGFPLNETPPSWMAEAWCIDQVRENISYGLAKDVGKTGSLCRTREYLSFLERALSVEQLVELFLYIRDEHGCALREPEFRPEFEAAFPKCVASLPPALRQGLLAKEFLADESDEGPPIPDEIPF
jgi:hypothetical protein